MSIPEQFLNPETEFDATTETDLEKKSGSSEQSEAEIKGQQLAAQIKDMYSSAKTKEDYAAVQLKIAELRSFFENSPEIETNKLLWRSLPSIASNVKQYKKEERNAYLNWEWAINQLAESEGDSSKLLITMPSFEKEDEVEKIKFDEPFPLKEMSSPSYVVGTGQGLLNLIKAVNHRHARSYIREDDRMWVLEVEPEPYRDFASVLKNIELNTDKINSNFRWGVGEMKNSKKISIQTNVRFKVPEDNIDLMEFNTFPSRELINTGADNFDNNLEELKLLIGNRGVKSYIIRDYWFLEIEPDVEVEPAAGSVEEIITKVRNFLIKEGQSDGSIQWKTKQDGKYIDMKTVLDNSIAENSSYFHKATQEDEQNILEESAARVTHSSLNYEILFKAYPAGTKVVSLAVNNRWFLKIVD